MDQQSSSDSTSPVNHGSDVTTQGVIQQNLQSVNIEYGWVPALVSNFGSSLILGDTHPEQNNHMSTSSGPVTPGSSTLDSATLDAITDKVDLNETYEGDVAADQEICADHVNQTSSLERNTEFPREDIRQRMNLTNEQGFFNSSMFSDSPVDSSQHFQPSYRTWVTSPSSNSNAVGSLFVASNGGYAFQQQENSQFLPTSSSMRSMLVSGTERGSSRCQHLRTSRPDPRNYHSRNGTSASPAGTLSHPLRFPQQNATRSFPSSFTNAIHLSSVMRFAGIGSPRQVDYQIPQPSIAATTMMNIIESQFGNNGRGFQAHLMHNDVVPHSLPQPSTAATSMMNITESQFHNNGRGFQAPPTHNDVVPRSLPQPSTAVTSMMNLIESQFGSNGRGFQAPLMYNDVVPRSLPPSQAVIDAHSRARLLRTVRQAFDILLTAGAFEQYEGGSAQGPLFFGVADLHDNLRLDVNNMSYEELLALEDCIGNVATGLAEDAVLGALRRVTYQSPTSGPLEEEICCVCQENIVDGEDLGMLDCKHKYHFDCVKQWLLVKNTCPICKNPALAI